MRRKFFKYRILRCDDRWDKWSIPTCFTIEEVARKRPHSEIFVQIPKGYEVPCHSGFRCVNDRDCWRLWDDQRRVFTDLVFYEDPSKLPRGEVWSAVLRSTDRGIREAV